MIRDRSEELHTFHARHFAEPISARSTDTNEHHSELADEEVIRLARGARNAAKFEAFWQGDISGYASHSEADQALVSLLAFYTQDENREIARWALEIVRYFNSYTELSASGSGLHIIVRGDVPNRRKGEVEVYSSKLFFTVTGHVVEVGGD